MKITYNKINGKKYHLHVRLDGRIVGSIRPVLDGFKYFPKNSPNGGERFDTVEEVKKSLQADPA
jgi:hypothetical protein